MKVTNQKTNKQQPVPRPKNKKIKKRTEKIMGSRRPSEQG